MVKRSYIPERGDFVFVDFDGGSGHEQKGKRPAIVISPKIYNQKSGLVIICPVTSQIKNYPFEVEVVLDKVKGVVLTDQIRSVDWGARNFRFIQRAERVLITEVLKKIKVLIEE